MPSLANLHVDVKARFDGGRPEQRLAQLRPFELLPGLLGGVGRQQPLVAPLLAHVREAPRVRLVRCGVGACASVVRSALVIRNVGRGSRASR